MPDSDKTAKKKAVPVTSHKTEIDLEFEQRFRLLDAFSMIETYDKREAIIRACVKSAKSDV